MKDTYTWDDIKVITNSCLNQYIVGKGKQNNFADYIKEVYNDNLPKAINLVAERLFLDPDPTGNNYGIIDIDIEMLRKAYKQLCTSGCIGYDNKG